MANIEGRAMDVSVYCQPVCVKYQFRKFAIFSNPSSLTAKWSSTEAITSNCLHLRDKKAVITWFLIVVCKPSFSLICSVNSSTVSATKKSLPSFSPLSSGWGLQPCKTKNVWIMQSFESSTVVIEVQYAYMYTVTDPTQSEEDDESRGYLVEERKTCRISRISNILQWSIVDGDWSKKILPARPWSLTCSEGQKLLIDPLPLLLLLYPAASWITLPRPQIVFLRNA